MTEKEVMRNFFRDIRSGKAVHKAQEYMHPIVQAHQLTSENEVTLQRTPEEYAAHVAEISSQYRTFSLEIDELLQENNKVYVRWTQKGITAEGDTIVQISSAVYLLKDHKILAYWIQIDREGLNQQRRKLGQPANL